MSYISQSPDVYQYAGNGVTSSIDQRVASYQQNQFGNSFNPPTFNYNDRTSPPIAYNQFGQSQIQRVYQPLSFKASQPQTQVNSNQVLINSNQPRSIVLAYPSPPTNVSIPNTKVNEPLHLESQQVRNSFNAANGFYGPNGLSGNNGVNVPNGINGINGVNVPNGINGVNVSNGINGVNNINVPNAINGVNGPNGLIESNRFDKYLHSQRGDFKYNLFSVIDEPWNSRKCSNLSGNECIATGKNSFRR